MMCNTITGSFDTSGGLYKCQFVDIGNGPALLNLSYGYINKSVSIKADSNLLKNALASFETSLNQQIKIYRSSLMQEAKTSGVQNVDANYGRIVEYKFTIPKAWESFTLTGFSADVIENLFLAEVQKKKDEVDSKNASGDNKTPADPKKDQAKDAATSTKVPSGKQDAGAPAAEAKPAPSTDKTAKPAPNQDQAAKIDAEAKAIATDAKYGSYVTTNISISIYQVLAEIIGRCDQLNKRAKEQRDKVANGNYTGLKIHKLLNNITSDDSKITVHYDFVDMNYVPDEIKNNPTGQDDKNEKVKEGTGDPSKDTTNKDLVSKSMVDSMGRVHLKPMPENSSVYEFNYIFSGENIDIRDFAMNLNNGLMYVSLSTMDNLSLYGSDKKNEPNSNPGALTDDATKNIAFIRAKDPVCLPANFLTDLKGNTNVKKKGDTENKRNLLKAFNAFVSIDEAAMLGSITIQRKS
jgi:hypothetical protein